MQKNIVLSALALLLASSIATVCHAQSSITSVSPTSADQGQTLDVRILGDNTDFTQGLSTATFGDEGVTVNSTTVTDSEHAVANISIENIATPSARDVNVLTGAEVPTPLSGGFTVKAPKPTITSISPASGTDDGIAFITDLAGTNFVEGATVKLMKSGEVDIDGEGIEVHSAMKISCDFDLTGADDGAWDVYVKNDDGQSATLQDGFEVTSAGSPAMIFTKSGAEEASVGDQINYSFTISNTGDEPLHSVSVTDSIIGAIDFGTIAMSETLTKYMSYTVKDSDPDPLVNNATAIAWGSSGTKITDKNSHSTDIVSSLLLLQKLGPTTAKNGETITYNFSVTNTSDEELDNVEVTDPLFGDDWSQEIGTLASLGSTSFTKDYTITDADSFPLTNTATVTADDKFGLQTTDTSTWTIDSHSGIYSSCGVSLIPKHQSIHGWQLLLLIPAIVMALRRQRIKAAVSHN